MKDTPNPPPPPQQMFEPENWIFFFFFGAQVWAAKEHILGVGYVNFLYLANGNY